jgi:hypothetical protein
MKKQISRSLTVMAGLMAAVVVAQGVASGVGATDNNGCPTNPSDTDKACATTSVGLTVGSTIGITLRDTPVNMTGGVGALNSDSMYVEVTTNSNGGYTLVLNTNVDNKNSLYHVGDSNKTCSAPYSCLTAVASTAPITSSTPNRWGVAFSNDSAITVGDSTPFSPVPSRNAAGIQIGEKDGPAVTAHVTYVAFGAWPTSSLPSGDYNIEVLYTATAQVPGA